MQIRLNFIGILLLFGMFQAIYQMVLLFISTKKNKANYFLISLLFIALLILFDYFSVISKMYLSFPYLVGISGILIAGIGPGLYFYNDHILHKKSFHIRTILHYLPIIILFWLNHPILLLSKAHKIAYIQKYYEGSLSFSLNAFIFFGFLFIHLSIYLYLTRNILFKKLHFLKENKSNAEVLRLNWLMMLLKIFSFFLIAFLLFYVEWGIHHTYTVKIESLLQLVLCAFVLKVSYFSIKNTFLFSPVIQEPEAAEKYKTSSINKATAKEYCTLLVKAMQTEKYYLDPNLNLNELARLVNIPSHQLSQVINQELSLNFFDFINQYRIEEVKKRLLNGETTQLTILGIALDTGFNNKGSFNRIFKKSTGVTPSAYIKGKKQL